MSKASELLGDFAHAVDRLAEACERVAADATGDALLRDGLIQRFEFCFELAWKAIQSVAGTEGVVVRSPQTALAHALQAGWSQDEALWFRTLEARNLCAHTYDEVVADEVASEVARFLPALRALRSGLAQMSE